VDVVDVTERLMSEFERQLGRDLITRVVTQCRHDLHGAPTGALPELLERAARQRLLTLLNSPPLKTRTHRTWLSALTSCSDPRGGAGRGGATPRRVRVYVMVRFVRGRPGGSELPGPGEAGRGEDAIVCSSRGTGVCGMCRPGEWARVEGMEWRAFRPATALGLLGYLRRVPSRAPAQRLGWRGSCTCTTTRCESVGADRAAHWRRRTQSRPADRD
jgi:hypothetical protein